MPSTDPFRPLTDDFADEAGALRLALGRALTVVLDEQLLSSRVIANRLGLDKTLGWACLRVATVHDVKATLIALPGRRGWAKIQKALQKAGCDEATLAALADAITTLRTRLDDAQIDRDALRAIAAGTPGDADEIDRDLRLRRRFFTNARLMWGVSAKAVVATHLLAPRPRDAERLDAASLQVVHGLERHHEGPPWTFHYPASHRPGEIGPGFRGDEPSRSAGMGLGTEGPLIEDLSSPGILGDEVVAVSRKRRGESRPVTTFEFANRRPDRRDPVRAVFGGVIEGIEAGAPEASAAPFIATHANTVPTSVLVYDLVLHEDLLDPAPPTVELVAAVDRNTSLQYRLRLEDQLALPLGRTGPGPAPLTLPRTAGDSSSVYRELVGRAAAAIGRDASEFMVFRTVVPHPPMPSTIVATIRVDPGTENVA